ncbi:MAG: bifunctional pyr operon transcriptional regulator/uracil phosphoribosyltransferase PyrR [Bacteroidetes bacterium SW_4_67_19]|jgi:pyrimidine operon attenuation protein/uracil phosphoribosyltransferase|nr:MAG: bifunctional pyr operon transcriptional regulator/uracil phosphoribosyltransferase PyrR [Bacteroidetes bacterium SW_4_67_19]
MEPSDMIKTRLMSADDLERTLDRMARQIIELITLDVPAASQNGALESGPSPPFGADDGLALVGLQTRGVHLARRLSGKIRDVEEAEVPVGVLDATLYRDDVGSAGGEPGDAIRAIRATRIPFDITGRDLVLVDDVIYTGRTGRAALDALMDMGRPASVRFLVMIDRGLRELPIRPDIVGRTVSTLDGEAVRVRLREEDDREGVWLVNVGD